jgi:hypothetical protein
LNLAIARSQSWLSRRNLTAADIGDVPVIELARLADVLDHVLARLPGPLLSRISEQAIRG